MYHLALVSRSTENCSRAILAPNHWPAGKRLDLGLDSLHASLLLFPGHFSDSCRAHELCLGGPCSHVFVRFLVLDSERSAQLHLPATCGVKCISAHVRKVYLIPMQSSK